MPNYVNTCIIIGTIAWLHLVMMVSSHLYYHGGSSPYYCAGKLDGPNCNRTITRPDAVAVDPALAAWTRPMSYCTVLARVPVVNNRKEELT